MGRQGKGKAAASMVPSPGAPTVDELVEEAQTQMLFGNYDKALELMRALHERDPENAEILDVSGSARTPPRALALALARGRPCPLSSRIVWS